MIFEFGLTPGLFADRGNPTGLAALEALLSMVSRESHLIGVARNKEWRPAIHQAIASLASPFRENLVRLVSVLHDRRRFVPRLYQTNPSHPPGNDKEWLSELIRAHVESPFDFIVTLAATVTEYEKIPGCVYCIQEVSDIPSYKEYERSRRIKRETSEFLEVLKPLLLHARSILLIDPHINPSVQRYRRPVAAMINATFDRGRYPAPAFVEMHLKAKEAPNEQEEEFRKWLLPKMNQGSRVRVVLWEEKTGQETFHNRFILTELCGIKVGQGLDEPKHGGPDYDDWDVMGETHRQEIWRQFQRGSITFDQKHEFYLTVG